MKIPVMRVVIDRWLVCVVIAVTVGLVVVVIRTVIDVPRQAYAVWGAADLVIAYMERHDGAWPRNWDDLRVFAEQTSDVTKTSERDGTVSVEFRPMASIEELQRRVEIDWEANPDKLRKTPRREAGPPFRVIYLRNGKSTHYEGREPNQMILDYLESRARPKAK